jgi:exodeoxyribonuclease V gamma subunit
MELIRSNRTENLADALASRVRERPLGPFAKEAIVVQSRGMERWLTLALAERLGIWSHPYFPFPRGVVEQVLDSLSEGRSEEAKAYDPGRLKWTIAELLRESAPSQLDPYLREPSDADRVLRLAGSVSNVFDDYVVYRPSLLQRWAKGKDPDWQAQLWRRVVERLGPYDLASRTAKALSVLRSKKTPQGLPFERLHLFSLETLPPLFLELFSVLSQTIPTTFYLLEPSTVGRRAPAAFDAGSAGTRLPATFAFDRRCRATGGRPLRGAGPAKPSDLAPSRHPRVPKPSTRRRAPNDRRWGSVDLDPRVHRTDARGPGAS